MKHDEKKIEEILEENDFDNLSLESKIRAEDSMKQYAEHMVQQTEKAFGGCTDCYGKGYSTVKDYEVARNYRKERSQIKYCSCDRGVQLKELNDDLVQQEREKAVSFAESIISLDKTPHYKYGGGEDSRNGFGELPDGGGRWNTPKEMAKSFIKAINQE